MQWRLRAFQEGRAAGCAARARPEGNILMGTHAKPRTRVRAIALGTLAVGATLTAVGLTAAALDPAAASSGADLGTRCDRRRRCAGACNATGRRDYEHLVVGRHGIVDFE